MVRKSPLPQGIEWSSKETPLASTEAAALGLVPEGTGLRLAASTEAVAVAPQPHSAADPSRWPELRLPRSLSVDDPLHVEVFAWYHRDPDRRVKGAKPRRVGGAVVTLSHLLGGGLTTLALKGDKGELEVQIDEVAQRSAAEQDARDAAAKKMAQASKSPAAPKQGSSACVLL